MNEDKYRKIKDKNYAIEMYNSKYILDEYPNVESITIEICNSGSSVQKGSRYTYIKSMIAYFYIECKFSECYGVRSGFDFSMEIRQAILVHKERFHIKKQCGGYGDLSLRYSCDNFVEAEIFIQYQD